MNTWRKVCCCLVAAFAAFGAWATTYHVSPDVVCSPQGKMTIVQQG